MDLKKLLTRSLSGIVYCLVIVGAILLEEKGTMMLGALLSVLACVEFSKICHDFNRKNMPALLLDIIGCVALCCGVLLYPLVIWTGIMVLRFVAELYMKEEDPLRNLGHSMMSQIYIGLPMGLMVGVAYLWTSNLLLALFFFIWINDTGAFLVGSTLGKHRLFERISPKKSWEGFFGGLFFNIIAAWLFWRFGMDFFGFGMVSDSCWFAIGFAVTVTVFGTWGDLVESLLKRTLKIKDSGNIIPGHGGILDRIDSFLLAMPAIFCYLLILG